MYSHFVEERHETVIEKNNTKLTAEEMCGKDDNTKYIFVTPVRFNSGLDSK